MVHKPEYEIYLCSIYPVCIAWYYFCTVFLMSLYFDWNQTREVVGVELYIYSVMLD